MATMFFVLFLGILDVDSGHCRSLVEKQMFYGMSDILL
jgi:hypothetical protein